MNLRTCASLRASLRTLRSRSSVCCSIALRALSSGPTTAINSGRSAISSSARMVNTLNLARPITRRMFLSSWRIEFLTSRLLLTSSARLASIALAEWLSRSLTRPCAGLHDAGDASRVVAVTLIDLHLEYRPGMARVDADHRQAKLFELGPQPCGRRSCLKADPYRSWCFRSHECCDRLRLGIDHALSNY